MREMQAALGVSVDGVAGQNTAKALKERLATLGITSECWGRGDRVIADISDYRGVRPDVGVEKDGTQVTPSVSGDWMKVARSALGLHERHDADELDRWLSSDGSWNHTAADTPWCGEFVDTCLRLAGHKTGLENPLGARNWLKFGARTELQFGAIMVFWRGRRDGWQGHVGFYIGEDETHYHILGGNQSNAVSVSRIKKDRFLGARWPIGGQKPSRFEIAPGSTTVNEA